MSVEYIVGELQKTPYSASLNLQNATATYHSPQRGGPFNHPIQNIQTSWVSPYDEDDEDLTNRFRRQRITLRLSLTYGTRRTSGAGGYDDHQLTLHLQTHQRAIVLFHRDKYFWGRIQPNEAATIHVRGRNWHVKRLSAWNNYQISTTVTFDYSQFLHVSVGLHGHDATHGPNPNFARITLSVDPRVNDE